MRTLATITTAALLGAAACSGGSDPAPADETPAAAAVSVRTSCGLLFTSAKGYDAAGGLWGQAVDIVAKSQKPRAWGGVEDARKARDIAEQLDKVAEASDADIQPHIQNMASAVRILDGAALKPAAAWVGSACAPYAAG